MMPGENLEFNHTVGGVEWSQPKRQKARHMLHCLKGGAVGLHLLI